MQQAVHRPGPLKQQNKSHKKGRHRSNREIHNENKGKVGVKTLSRKGGIRDLSREERRNREKQLRATKRQETLAIKRGLGSESTPPVLVFVYSRSGVYTLSKLFNLLKGCTEDAVISTDTDRQSTIMYLPRFKTRYHFITVPDNDLFAVMDAVKVADILLLVHSLATESIDDDPALNTIYNHFLPTTLHIVQGLEELPTKKRSDIKGNLQSLIEDKFPGEKLHSLDKESDALQVLNLLANCKRKNMSYKSKRSQIVSQETTFTIVDGADTGLLTVSGYVRSQPLDVNGLIHVPGWGDFQIESIEVVEDPHAVRTRKSGGDVTMTSNRCLKPDPLIQESLERENELDPMEGEQTFPTAEEIAAAAAEEDAKKKIQKKVPKGTSDYQAAWIIDEEDNNNEDDGDGESDGSGSDASDDEEMEAPEEIEDEDDDASSGEETFNTAMTTNEDDAITTNEEDPEKYDEKMNENEEEDMRKKYKEAKEEEMFPDEVETPPDVPARVRFARYRGLRSFNYSSWDPKENLPSDYSRIFQFENFNRTKRRVMSTEINPETSVEVGSYVRVTIKGVDKQMADYFSNNAGKPLILFGLLRHENKLSVMNVLLRKAASFEEPIKAKERLIFHVGCRRFATRPILSAHTNGNKFKYERFLRPDEATVASFYAPITFPPCSVVVFKEHSDGRVSLVASGSVLSINPDRMVIKRIILSGHPFKISKKLAVVRYMFYNKDDVLWFKPVELVTKYGRKGNIKEPLGTHGHMKCYFDRQLNSMDTVLMHLYKRVFPKWILEERLPDPVFSTEEDEEME